MCTSPEPTIASLVAPAKAAVIGDQFVPVSVTVYIHTCLELQKIFRNFKKSSHFQKWFGILKTDQIFEM